MDTDKIIVNFYFYLFFKVLIEFKFKCLSDGCLMNIGRPFDLLQDPSTILYKLVKNLSREEALNLYLITKKHVKEDVDTPTDSILID